MECSTGGVSGGKVGAAAGVLASWEQFAQYFPADLEASARAAGALRRRRKVKTARDLLHMALLYAGYDWSLRMVGLWCHGMGIGDLSDVAILNRLRHSAAWLGCLLVQILARQTAVPGQVAGQAAPAPGCGVRVRLQDASVITSPRRGANWRVHLSYDLAHMRMLDVVVTDDKGGETLARFKPQPGDIVIADRGYNAAASLCAILTNGGDFIVRMQHSGGAPLDDRQGQRFATVAWLRQCFPQPYTGLTVSPPVAIDLTLVGRHGRFPVRLIACALPPAAAQRARKRALDRARRSRYTASADGLFAVGFFFVLTSLPTTTWPAQQIVDFYRFRWQVELHFKRLKSILHLDHLRALDPDLVQTYLLAKLLLALVLDVCLGQFHDQVPEWFEDCHAPLSLFRTTTAFWAHIQAALCRPIYACVLFAAPAHLRRYLCNTPRRRPSQAAHARAAVNALSPPLPLC